MGCVGKPELLILGALALTLALFQLLAGVLGPYGYFIDEFYYLACARHVAAGYVNHPPLSILMLAATRALAGESLAAIRVLPALASGGLVFMTGIVAAEFGGRRGAIVLAALASAVMPVYC